MEKIILQKNKKVEILQAASNPSTHSAAAREKSIQLCGATPEEPLSHMV